MYGISVSSSATVPIGTMRSRPGHRSLPVTPSMSPTAAAPSASRPAAISTAVSSSTSTFISVNAPPQIAPSDDQRQDHVHRDC